MFRKINSIGLFGMNAFPVSVEMSKEEGIPRIEVTGLGDVAVHESRLRAESALLNSGVQVEKIRRLINLSPAAVRKSGSVFDMAILTAVLAGDNLFKMDVSRYAFVGETSLNGDFHPINGALTMVLSAKEKGLAGVFLPDENAAEASVARGIKVFAVKSLRHLLLMLQGKEPMDEPPPYVIKPVNYRNELDFSEVRGQESVKKALEVAAAGFHNIIMIGTPGTGKSMLSKRIPTILPPMSFDESIETTEVHSVVGILDKDEPLVIKRPFRSISHTASAAGLIGGGGIPQPGEISLAHNGVLFLDELPEFERRTLETLRQPLEDGVIHISRASGKASYPCNVMLVAAMNPCPCGNFGHPTKACTCTDKQINLYLGRISQPVLDRIDIQAEVAPITYEQIAEKGISEESKYIRERVEKARHIQEIRFKGTSIRVNSSIPPGRLQEYCILEEGAKILLKNSFEKLGLSARAYDKILKVARTVADLDGIEIIKKNHIATAIAYRSLDKKYWNRR